MLIGRVFELTPDVPAYENMANRLADRIRDIWLVHKNRGDSNWQDTFFEDPDGVVYLSRESFPNLKGIDYIFRWWGHEDDQGLAGDLQVIWKIMSGGEMKIYRTTIRFADRDFPSSSLKQETRYRVEMRQQFSEAFQLWQQLYAKIVS